MGWRDGWTFYPSDAKKSPIHQDAVHKEPDGHSIDLLWADFVDAIETGRRPTCDVQIGHDATNMSLLGMLSMKLGRSVKCCFLSDSSMPCSSSRRLQQPDLLFESAKPNLKVIAGMVSSSCVKHLKGIL